MHTDIIELDADHPGFNDEEYRLRRNELAAQAGAHKAGTPIPHIDYTDSENTTWTAVYTELSQLYPTHACCEYLDALGGLGLSTERAPQLRDIDDYLCEKTGFHIQPVAGLVESRAFMKHLANRAFPSTTYIRHHSTPQYTPEPDLCHEILGHVPLLAVPEYADLMQLIGEGAEGASDEQITQIGRLYWYTIEFGVLRGQDKKVRAYGAGLLSSPGELAHAVEERPIMRHFDFEVARHLENPITTFQPVLFEVCSIKEAFFQVGAAIERIRHNL